MHQLAANNAPCARVGVTIQGQRLGGYRRAFTGVRIRETSGFVERAAIEMRVHYPIAVDSDHAVWNAFGNKYWPALYFVDAGGHIRHHQFGEGDYERSESVIRELLSEAGHVASGIGSGPVEARGAEVAADWRNLKTPEFYVGHARATNFASPGGLAATGKPFAYSTPSSLRRNAWALSGTWTVEEHAAISNKAGDRIALRFHARDLHLVMGATTSDKPVRFRVRIDGRPPGAAHGEDVDAEGYGSATTPRLYQLIRQPGTIGDRRFDIEFLDPGAQAFAFTFG